MKQSDLFAYASTFVSFLVRELGDKLSNINQIILYGSVAKGEATKNSDVDIFVDIRKKLVVKEIVNRFHQSREATLFRVKGIEQEISVKVGELKKWKELENSISSSGIVLWGRYEPKAFLGEHKVIFSWEKIGKNRGAFLNKLYGYTINGKRYIGIVEAHKGGKIGKSGIIVPFEHRDEFVQLLKKYKVKSRHWDVLVKE